MEKEIYLQYYPLDKEIHIWLTNADETKTVSQYDDGIGFNQEKIMTLEHGQFFELYNALAQVNIKEFLDNNGEGDTTDGAAFEIAFGGIVDKVHIELTVTKDNMEKRKVKSICEAVKRILEIAEIDKKEYENDF